MMAAFDAKGTSTATPRALVGRVAELEALRAALAEALAGRGGLALLSGEAGIGKTRVMEEIADEAVAGGFEILWGRCWDQGQAPAYWPWIQLMRAFVEHRQREVLRRDLADDAVEVAQLVPEVGRVLPDLREPPERDPEQARRRLFEAVAAVLVRAAESRPLLLILDDLHGADVPSLHLLATVRETLAVARILVLGAFRGAEAQASAALWGPLSALLERALHLEFSGLAAAEVENLVARAAAGEAGGLAEAIHRITGGNPFFVDEILRLMAAEDRFRRPPGTHLEGFRAPEHVRDAIRRRVGQLAPDVRQVLGLAAAAGSEFHVAVLEATRTGASQRSGSAEALLKAARANGMVDAAASTPGVYAFSHALTRQTVYEDLPPGTRLRLHAELAAAMQRIYAADLESHVEEIAVQMVQAAPGGCADDAIEYCRRAARHCRAIFAHEAAAGHAERALELLPLVEGEAAAGLRLALLLDLGEALNLAGERERARAVFRDAAAAARGRADAAALGRAALGFGGGASWSGAIDIVGGDGVDPDVRELVLEALDALAGETSAVRALLLARLGTELRFEAAASERESLAGEALEVARRLGDRATLAYVLAHRHFSVWSLDNAAARRAVAEEGIRLAAASGEQSLELMNRAWLMSDLLELGETRALAEEERTFAAQAERSRLPTYLWASCVWRAMRALLDGQYAHAEELIGQALPLGSHLHRAAPLVWQLQLYNLRRDLGRAEELAALEPILRAQVAMFPALPNLRVALALLHTDLGREADAREQFEVVAADGFSQIVDDGGWFSAMAEVAEVCHRLGDAPRAGVLYERIQPYGERNAYGPFAAYSWGALARTLGTLAATRGDWRAAESHFETALERNRALNARSWVLRTEVDYAAMLQRRGAGARARAIAQTAAETAAALGMAPLAARGRAIVEASRPS